MNARMWLQSLDVETEGFLPGFTVTIPEVLELRRKYDLLELLLLDGEEKTLLWECAGDDLDELVKDKLVEFHIDRVEVLYGLMLEIQGWTTDPERKCGSDGSQRKHGASGLQDHKRTQTGCCGTSSSR